ncbi:MAG: indolepyruvate oxidoreductase subunit beta [Deltaproteobacteria bacterium]|nr:indolepyruvate oxidoreductase subunit beta [Candidatus Zymogenaceae bacterium]
MKHNGAALAHDPTNIIIAGVGGQGNIMASQLLGKLLVTKGFEVIIGETYGASQRGGSVMSHLRVAGKGGISPIIPKGKAHYIIALEPAEALRVMGEYGNPDVRVLSNTRPIYPVDVSTGALDYPDLDNLKKIITDHAKETFFVDATDIALRVKTPILANIIMLGAFAQWGVVPLSVDEFKEAIRQSVPEKHLKKNIEAFEEGMRALAAS